MKTTKQDIKLNENNRIMQEITKTETKKYTSEVKKIASKYISELQKDMLRQRNFDIFDKTCERKIEDIKAVYNWFVEQYYIITDGIEYVVQEVLRVFNKINKSNLSLEDLVKADNELDSFFINGRALVELRSDVHYIIEKNFSSNTIWIEDFCKFDYIFFSFFLYYIEDWLNKIIEAFSYKNEKYIKELRKILEKLLKRALKQEHSLNVVLHEYQIMSFGQNLADLILYNSLNIEDISKLF